MINSTSNKQVKRVVNLRDKAKARREEGLYVAEGMRMCREYKPDDVEILYITESFGKQEDNKKWLRGFKFEMVTDEVMHYMADYFTFPHNKNFTGNLYEHNKYEKHLKNHLKRYIESGAADRMVILPVNFGSFRELVEYIGNAHERYLLKERNIAEDVQYILRICSQVIHGILQLAAKQFGREDILIPAAC